MKILTVDVGGTHVKFLASGQNEKREFRSGKQLTAAQMVREVLDRTRDWDYEAVSVGYPGLADHRGPRAEPENLGDGWVGFDFAAAFGKPVKVLNDAALQALGSYEGGRMLFLGLGTAVGSALIAEKAVVPLARPASRFGTASGRLGAIVALVAGLIAAVNGGLNLAVANGGPGTGNGVVGGAAALVLGLIGMALGGLALGRSRSAG
jgi:predicted NBD/HSP70 family sugar kinase